VKFAWFIRVAGMFGLCLNIASAVAQTPEKASNCDSKVLLAEIEQALKSIKQEFGPDVFKKVDLDGPSGDKTLGAAWNRHLVAAGFPKSLVDRENCARALDLDQRASLIMGMGIAKEEAIEYLQSSLRRIAPNSR
jgi:hypothetical protein